ncbi:hypothetical protein V2W45_700080 [Cenococcum geophilum]
MENTQRLSHHRAEDPTGDSSSLPSNPTTGPHRKTVPSGIKLFHDAQNSAADIIFVHGLTGDREKTWTAKDAKAPWPQTLLPDTLPNARVLTFGYDAYVADWMGMVSKNRIGNHSMNLLTAVATYRENDDTNNRPIVFVCHSLGGLVCEDRHHRDQRTICEESFTQPTAFCSSAPPITDLDWQNGLKCP